MPVYNKLTRGLNLWGWSASVDMVPGEALYCQNVLFRPDGAFYKHWGWRRIYHTAFAGATHVLAHKGFNYKGKNAPAAGVDRPGNFGIANDLADYTRRAAFYSTAIVLTNTELRIWNPATEAFDLPTAAYAGPTWIPTGVTITADTKPTILIFQNNAYIFGWASHNLRYDPVDRQLYILGWDTVPANAGHTGLQAGGTLQENAIYRYRVAWTDLYTGEQSELSAEYVVTTTAANRTVLLDNFVAYAGNRYYIDAALADQDVGLTVYRTDAGGEIYYFLALVNPGLAAAALTDNGLATDKSIRAIVRDYAELPRLSFATEFRTMLFGVSWDTNWARIYYNDFRAEKSFWTRTDPRNFRELPLQDGEVLTAIQRTDDIMVVFSSQSAYEVQAVPNTPVDLSLRPLEWTVGCVGPKATCFVDGWVYWLSDRGPYRWRPGMFPQHIGKVLLSLFIDPETGLCQLNEGLRSMSEVFHDPDADVVRFVFACGPSAIRPNRHVYYWHRADEHNGNPASGWCYGQHDAQCFDFTNVYEGLVGGLPVDPFDRRNRLIWADAGTYLNENDPDLRRAGLPTGQPATGVAQAGSGVNLIVTTGGLYLLGDDMTGMRLEVAHLDGTIDVTTVLTNTAVNIVPAGALSQNPTGATWYVGGVGSFWRSWVDHSGQPGAHKDITHFHLGFNLEDPTGNDVIDIQFVVADDWPTTATQTVTSALDKHRDKVLLGRTGRFMTYEIANTRPDEQFMVSYIEPEVRVLLGRRR